MFIFKDELEKQNDSYHKNFFYTVHDSDGHFILQGNLKTVVLTRKNLVILIKPRNIMPLDITHILTVCSYHATNYFLAEWLSFPFRTKWLRVLSLNAVPIQFT